MSLFDHLYASWFTYFQRLLVGDIMSGWQDSLMLKLALQFVGDQSPISRKSIADKSQTSCWRFHSQYIHEIGRRQIGDRSATVQRLVGDWSRTYRKSLQLVGDWNQSRLVFCAYSKAWPRLILYGYRSPTLLRPCCYLWKNIFLFCIIVKMQYTDFQDTVFPMVWQVKMDLILKLTNLSYTH